MCSALTWPVTAETKPAPFCRSYIRNFTYTSLNMHSSVFPQTLCWYVVVFFREEVPLSTSLFELADRLLGFNRYMYIWKELQFRVINWSSCLTLPVKQTPYTPGKVCFITSTFGLEMDIKSMSGTAHYSWLQGPVWLLFSEKKPSNLK